MKNLAKLPAAVPRSCCTARAPGLQTCDGLMVPIFADMGIWVKTTIEIADSLLEDAKALARRQKTTLRALVEEGLRHVIERRRKPRAERLRLVTFRGRGLRPEIGSFADMLDRAYEGRGS